MSTTGHYTRYINQYPGWSDNCDTMVHHIPGFVGYFQVEHYAGNKKAFSYYHSFEYGKKEYSRSEFTMKVYEYSGHNAIQNVLKCMQNFPVGKLVDMILKYRFYNRSYMDYFDIVQEMD